MTNLSCLATLLLALLLALVATIPAGDAFTFQSPLPRALPSTICHMAKKGKKTGKGFGEAPAATTSKKSLGETASKSFEPMATKPQPQQTDETMQATAPPTSPVVSQNWEPDDMNQGKIALENMRRKRAEEKDADLRKVKQVRDMDKMLQSSPDAAAIPEKVAMRMGKRMLPFVGLPLFGSMGAFVAFWYFATYKDLEFQPGLVATTTIVMLLSGLLGITYSIVSASWDEDREGSFLGLEEFQRNVASIRQGLDRSRENLLLRERMAGLPEEEIERALADLDKRERREKTEESLQNKIGDELEN